MAYSAEKPAMPRLHTSSWRVRPNLSANAPVIGAENAEKYVRSPRNRPDAAVLPPRS
jgi:hypothetical protein